MKSTVSMKEYFVQKPELIISGFREAGLLED